MFIGADQRSNVRVVAQLMSSVRRLVKSNREVSWDKMFTLRRSVSASITFLQPIPEVRVSVDKFPCRCVSVGQFLRRSLSVTITFLGPTKRRVDR